MRYWWVNQQQKVGSILGQPTVPNFHEAKLPLEEPKQVFQVRQDSGFDLS